MSIKKQIASAIATLALGAALIGGGTFAYFSDQAVSSGNTFATGTVNLTSGTSESLPTLSFNNKKPGDTQLYSYALNNSGTLDISKILLSMNYTSSDATNDLGTQLHFNYLKLGNTTISLLPADGNADGTVTLKELKTYCATPANKIQLPSITLTEAAKNLEFELEFIEAGVPQNEYQGDSVTFDINLDARQ